MPAPFFGTRRLRVSAAQLEANWGPLLRNLGPAADPAILVEISDEDGLAYAFADLASGTSDGGTSAEHRCGISSSLSATPRAQCYIGTARSFHSAFLQLRVFAPGSPIHRAEFRSNRDPLNCALRSGLSVTDSMGRRLASRGA
jgi:hypothetical protein